MNVKLLLLPSIILVIGKARTLSAEPCYSSDYGHARVNESNGVVQLCVFQFGQGSNWQYVTTEGWTNTAAKVVCRELGYIVYSSPMRRISNRGVVLNVYRAFKVDLKYAGVQDSEHP